MTTPKVMESRRTLQTILFTDIVGSTERAIDLGDRGWRQVLKEHHAHVRREIRRFGGREIKTMGDGFMAAFGRPAQAIRCAWSIREMVRQLGLEVRSGVHTGEVEWHGKDLTGVAVHIGSRITNEADPGEILVSHAVREMETGAGFRFEDRGRRSLKGVPGEWRLYALRGLPAGPTFRTGRWVPEITTHHAWIAGGALLAILVLVASTYLVVRELSETRSPRPAVAATAAPGIAVLPFTVQGEDLEVMREGMVSLLSMTLDDIVGLRGISNRTILARWDEHTSSAGEVDLPSALAIAQDTGARYAVVGDAVSSGERMRLSAHIYEVESGEILGRVRIEGASDSIMSLVDRLSVDIVRVVLERKGDIPEIDLASLTTESHEALLAYLEGEVHFRHFDLTAAKEAYMRAIQVDSTFALAHYRLSNLYGWVEASNPILETQHIERAAELADRLPSREALLVRASYALNRSTLDEVDPLRRAVKSYPDDAEAWYLLGETYLHIPSSLAGNEEIDALFKRAVELDPKNARYLKHYVEFAWHFHGDSALAEERLGLYEQVAPRDAPWIDGARLAMVLAFGNAVAKKEAMDGLLFQDPDVIREATDFLAHPRYVAWSTALRRALYQRGIELDEFSCDLSARRSHSICFTR